MLVCTKCHQVIVTDWETYTLDAAGNIIHTHHVTTRSSVLFVVLALALLLLLAHAATATERRIKKPPGDTTCAYSCPPFEWKP